MAIIPETTQYQRDAFDRLPPRMRYGLIRIGIEKVIEDTDWEQLTREAILLYLNQHGIVKGETE